MGAKESKKRVERAGKTGSLTFAGGSISKLPKEVKKLARERLQNLNVSDNKFKVVDPLVFEFVSLKLLDMSANRLVSVPGGPLSALKRLETLELSGNELKELPQEVWSLPKLKTLRAAGNRLAHLGDPTAASQLQVLDVSRNALVALPALNGLVRLQELNADDNKIAVLEDDWRGLARLRTVRLCGNALETLPAALLKLPTLGTIEFTRNPVYESQRYYKLDGYDDYMARRKEKADKGVHHGLDVKLS